jgi:predicted ATPase/class 3 adenylate cyclase
MATMSDRPAGIVTFLFTDIEGSTSRWEEQEEEMRVALARHDRVLREAIGSRGGWVVKHTGDGVLAAFASPGSAAEAAIDAQRSLYLPVRIGLATGEAELRDDDYFGPTLNRAARVMAAAHGGQVLVSSSTAVLLEGFELVDLGEHRLKDLSRPQRLFQLCAAGLKKSFPPLRTLEAAGGNLPLQSTSFIGREKEVASVIEALRLHRLVTLTGVGGVGKTRLALQVAAELASRYQGGAWLVELAPIGDAAATAHAIAATVGIGPQPGKTIAESLIEGLAGRHVLLVLDNCEHLIDAVAELSERIVRACAGVTLLATSREALRIEGEQSWPVPSLDFREGAQSTAVRLFDDRARAVVPSFELTTDVEAVTEICHRLDGIPLAIELAAARVRSMSPAQIRAKLDERFRLLTGGSRRALERHQTLRHAVQWSYDLLDEGERALLRRASVFAGGFTLEAAEAVSSGDDFDAADVVDLLDSLVRKSLLTTERSGLEVRYGLLETIRQFGEELLAAAGEAEGARARHAEFFARQSDAMFEIWRSPRQRIAHEWIDREIDNLRAAFRWAVDRDSAAGAVTIAANVGDLARFRLRHEAAHWAAEVADMARAMRHPRLSVLLTWASSNAWGLGHFEEARRFGEEAVSLREDPRFYPFVWAFTDLATVALHEGDVERALALVKTGAAHEADRHDRLCLASVPFILALAGRREEAAAACCDAMQTVSAAGAPFSMVILLTAKGIALSQSDPTAALVAFDEALELSRLSGNRLLSTMILSNVAALQVRAGEPKTALQSLLRALDDSRGSVDRGFLANVLAALVVIFERLGRVESAATLHGAVLREFKTLEAVWELPEACARIRSTLGDSEFQRLAEKGVAMPIFEIVRYAEGEIRAVLGGDE